jgi:GntR family transcriptional regulator/MocR family aminotransferase
MKSNRPVWGWGLNVALKPERERPLFLQIARAVSDDIRRGRLRSGDPLPGSRALAGSLRVHRNTVLAAYGELQAEGWIETSAARGTFVARRMPEVRPEGPPRHRPGVPARSGFDLPAPRPFAELPPPRKGLLLMPGGTPDVRLLPVAPLARAYRRALRGQAASVLAYNDARGHARLRAGIAAMLAATRGLAASADDVLVTRGSQMALDLAARTLCRPGDVVAVEALGYRPGWEVFRGCGAELHALPVDAGGVDVDALDALTRRTRVRAVYLTPHHHYPTTVTLSAPRRLALLELARRRRIAVIEDDYDHEFHYEGRPVLPLASADRAGVVVYVGTLAKILAPGLRLGYIVAPRDLLARLVAQRYYVDRQGDHAIEAAVADLLEEGEVQRHARRARRVYEARRDALAGVFRRAFGSVLSFDVPSGGMALWTRVAPGIDVDRWAAEAERAGVVFMPGRLFTIDGARIPHARFGFAALDDAERHDAVRRLGRALSTARRRR